MKKIVIIIIFFNHRFGFSQDLDARVFWSDSTKLEWCDFQGQIDFSSKVGKYEPTEALSTIGVEYTYMRSEDDRFYYTINCVFYKKESWNKSFSNLLLLHEQVHFDIYELGLRNIRKKLIGLNEDGIEFDLKKMVRMELDSIGEVQSDFDNDTDFGTLEKVQNEWNERIQIELTNMLNYSSDRQIFIK